MAGLNFYTQTLINSAKDPDSGKDKFTGSSTLFKVLRDFSFYKDKKDYGRILSVIKAPSTPAEMCKAELNMAKSNGLQGKFTQIPAGQNAIYCRLDIYVGVEGAEPYIYSNPWVQKGMPFWVEFSITSEDLGDTSGNKLAKKIEKVIKENHIFLCDKDLIKVSSTQPGKVTLEGTADYQRFRKIEISTFNASQDDAEVIAKMANKTTGNESDIIKLVTRGKAGFGTYSHIIKDLRLPTAANYQWSHIRQDETPIVGATYDQYIIEYEAPATNEGLGAVGQKLNSITTHVFWVKSDVVSAWDNALNATVTSVPYPSGAPDTFVRSVSESSSSTEPGSSIN